MQTAQHTSPQAHHAPKYTRNNMRRHPHRQYCKPPSRHFHQPLQHHKVRMMSVDHSLLENHHKQHTRHTWNTRVPTKATFRKQNNQRVEKWLRTFLTPPPSAATSTKPSHPLAFKQTHQPKASTTNKSCKCMPKVAPRQIHNKRNKNTETKNQYNFSQTYSNQKRKSVRGLV
jgi:hypothetical protein